MEDNIDKIFKAIENEFKISHEDILSKNKKKHMAEARGILYYALHYHLKLSSAQVGKICNRQTRSIKKTTSDYKFLIENQERYKKIYEKVLNAV